MITKLTKEQEAKMPEYVKKFTEIGLSTHDALPSKDIIRPLVDAVYQEGGLAVPEFIIYVKNPEEGCRASKMLQEKLVEIDGTSEDIEERISQDKRELDISSELYNCGYGTHDMSWLAYYMFCYAELGIEECKKLVPLFNLSKEIGWYWALDKAVVICPKPSKILRNSAGRLHNTEGSCLDYSGVPFLHQMNGVSFTGAEIEFVNTPASDLDVHKVLNIKNVEQRAEVIKKIGIEKFINHLKPVILDKVDSYELLSISLRESGDRIYLRMQNPSVDEVHIEAVHPDCRTVDQARHWRNFGIVELSGKFVPPLVLT